MLGYIPQIKTLIFSNERGNSISLSTWFLWLGTWVISLSYGVLCLQDLLFSMTCIMNVIGHITVIFLVLFKREIVTFGFVSIKQK